MSRDELIEKMCAEWWPRQWDSFKEKTPWRCVISRKAMARVLDAIVAELRPVINAAIVRHTGPDYDPYPLRDEILRIICE